MRFRRADFPIILFHSRYFYIFVDFPVYVIFCNAALFWIMHPPLKETHVFICQIHLRKLHNATNDKGNRDTVADWRMNAQRTHTHTQSALLKWVSGTPTFLAAL